MQKKKLNLSVQILIGLVLGIVAGLLLQKNPEIATKYIRPLGTVFLNAIKMIIVPLVFSSLVVGVCNLNDINKLGSLGGKTFLYYMFTTLLAVSLGLVFANILNPGLGFALPTEELIVEAKEAPSFIETLVNIIPSNPLQSLVGGNMLQIIVFALVLGAGILVIGERGRALYQVFDGLAETMYKITGWIMRLAPIGVFGLMTPVVASQGMDVLQPLLKVIIAVYLASIAHMLITYSLTVRFLGRRSPLEFFKGAFPAWVTAFTTASSSGTLPVSIACAEENLKVPKPVASFVLPLGATINMDGTAIYQGVCVLFIAQVYGLDLSFAQQITVVLTATLASIGTAGVPGAGLIMLSMVLHSVGLPLEGIALVAGIDRILDMMRTSVNVLGDISASVIVSRGVDVQQQE
ncbi:MAG: dicarboxylate/amino acid:cation symporter [Tissierellia bacterium]|nr:dicarboxylate/amino acid:cation symporter [Tissierellia bacterium]